MVRALGNRQGIGEAGGAGEAGVVETFRWNVWELGKLRELGKKKLHLELI
jgi:hypothetical protein